MESLSLIVFEIFEKTTHMTFDLGSRSNVMVPNESPCMISYMSTIQIETLSLTVFRQNSRFYHGSRSNIMAPNESPCMISYMTTIKMETLSLLVFEKSSDFIMGL